MVEHKVKDVSDEVCKTCPQCWQGECRAFEFPHSQEERLYREEGKSKC